MLNGLAPIMIFHFYSKPDPSLTGSDLGLLSEIANLIGIPIPVYFGDEGKGIGINASGLIIDSESQTLDITVDVEGTTEKDLTGDTASPKVSQRVVDSLVSISFVGSKNSALLTAIMALSEMVLKRAVSKEYGITYLNGSTVIFNGLLHSFRKTPGANDDLLRVEMTISNAKQGKTATAAKALPVGKVLGTVPL